MIFDQDQAARYDDRFAALQPLRDALHFLIQRIMERLPVDSRILVVGAGTGAELFFLAEKFPSFTFTVVEPSESMLAVLRHKAGLLGVESRLTIHQTFVEKTPPSPHQAALSLLVSQFILEPPARREFFRAIADRTESGGLLITADLIDSPQEKALDDFWFDTIASAGFSPQEMQQYRSVLDESVSRLPDLQVRSLLQEAGFENLTHIFRAFWINAWFATKAVG